jgi:hypothetical protein
MAIQLGSLLVAIAPKIIDAIKDKKNYTKENLIEVNTLMTTFPCLGLAVMSLMTLPQEPSIRDWVVTAGLVLVGCGAFYMRQKP